jgi:dUTP pyrophosphatase
VILRVVRLSPQALLPSRAYEGDAGLDLYSAEAVRLQPGERASVGCGIALVNAPGLIDAGYRGEVRVLLLNTDRDEPFAINPGERIAQLLIVAFAAPQISAVEELEASERGERGFGSSG